MSADRLPGALLPLLYLLAVLVLSAGGFVWALRQERRNPTSYSRRPEVLASWRAKSTAEQAAHDNAVLNAAEAAEEAVRRAVDLQVQRAVEDAVRTYSLRRPL
jgi:hypothetical protein